METIENNYNDEEEISLIDLFAVILRFRKMIIIGTVLVTFLAGIYLFVLPKLVASFNKKKVTVTYTVELNSLPRSISNGLSSLGLYYDLAGNLSYAFKNYPSIAKEYKKNPFMGEDYPKDSLEYNYFIQDLIKTKKITINGTFGNSYALNFELPRENLDVLYGFVKDYLNILNEGAENKAAEYIDELERKTKQSIKDIELSKKSSSSSSSSSSIYTGDMALEQSLRDTLQDIENLKKKPVVFYTLDEEPFILNVSQGRAKKLVIVCFASFFIFIFIAFAKNAVKNIKDDPEASETLKLAWENGK